MQFIPWEQMADGTTAQLKTNRRPIAKANFTLKQVALSKMTDISLLSAEFHGDPIVFEPRISVLLDMSTHVEFRGIYQARTDEEDQEDTQTQLLPSLALRQASWIRADDFKQFNMAESKKAYIESEKQIHASISFTTPALQPEIYQLMTEAKNLVRTGIRMEPAQRPDSPSEQIQLQLNDETLQFTLSYTPYTQQLPTLEMWIEQWAQRFAQVDFSKGIRSDQGCFISYSPSLMELLSRFPE